MHLIFALLAWLTVSPLGGALVSADRGPGLDPWGAQATSEDEGDLGPSMDPYGVQATSEDDEDRGPGLDPLG